MITNAHRINRGESPQLGGEISDFYLFAEEDAEKASALVVDVVNRRIPAKFGIRGIPTLMIFKDGQLAATKVGAMSKAQLTAFIDQQLA